MFDDILRGDFKEDEVVGSILDSVIEQTETAIANDWDTGVEPAYWVANTPDTVWTA